MSNNVQQYALNDQIMRIYDSANNDAYIHIKQLNRHVRILVVHYISNVHISEH